jgi:hypothetical protein
MSSRRARVGSVIDRNWGEVFDLLPRTRPEGDPNARFMSDPARDGFSFVGRFTSNAEDVQAQYRATSLQTTKTITSSTPVITVVRSNLTGPVNEGDVLHRRETGEDFIVGKASDGGFDRVVYKLRPSR